MALECAICGSKKNVNAVCHHCGKPLCAKPECRIEADDSAFTASAAAPVQAVHCPECWQSNHGAGRPRRAGARR